jgi:hypothetical protein
LKRVFVFVAAVALTVATMGVLAQTQPQIVTRKLNLAKSKFAPGAPFPKGETRTIELLGNGLVKNSTNGISSNGSRIAYSYMTSYDGKDSPISGVGFPLGADTVAETRVDAYTTTSIAKKAGKVVMTTRSVVSKDGKVTTITTKGVTEKGQQISSTLVWDKQ